MSVTIVENQVDSFKKKIENFYAFSKICATNGNLCPVQDVLAPTVDKWSLFILYYLAYCGRLRFSKLKELIPNISGRMLSVTLKRLEKAELLTRQVYAEVPPRVEYTLTPFGLEYSEKLIDLNLWLIEEKGLAEVS